MTNAELTTVTKTFVDQVLTVKITTKEDMVNATNMLSQVKTQIKKVTDEKEKVTKPLNAARAAERKRWKPFEDMLTKAQSYLRAEISRYQTEEDRKAEQERDRIASRVGTGKGKLKMETAVAKMSKIDSPETTVASDSGSVSFKDDYEFTVVNWRDIPEQYLKIDFRTADIKAALKAGVEIPGITFKKIKVPINRTN